MSCATEAQITQKETDIGELIAEKRLLKIAKNNRFLKIAENWPLWVC
jgi:hypothetical protein